MAEYGVGIVGTGWVAGEHIRAYENNPKTEVVALCSRTMEGARAKMEETGIECELTTDYEQMLANDAIDIVSICTPNDLHVDQTVKGAQAGKHMVLEKPVALSLEGLRRAQEAVEKAGVKTVVSFVLRWNPLFETIKSLLADNSIGNIFYAEVDYFHAVGPWYNLYSWNIKKERGGSSLLSAGCHAMDGLRWFMPGEIVEVHSYSHNGNPDFSEYEYDPTSVTILKFADGRIGKVASCLENVSPYIFDIELWGDGGTIRNNKLYSDKLNQTDFAEIPTILPDSGDVTHHPFQGEIDHLVECIEQDSESFVNLEDAAKTHELCFAADLSAERGKPVRISELG